MRTIVRTAGWLVVSAASCAVACTEVPTASSSAGTGGGSGSASSSQGAGGAATSSTATSSTGEGASGAGGAGGVGGVGGAGGGPGGAGGTGGAPATICDPHEFGWAPKPECGVFISPLGSDVAGNGTPQQPYATFDKALAVGGDIYACDGKYIDVAVTFASAVNVYGGMDCSGGSWEADIDGRSEIVGADSPDPVVWVSANNGLVHVENVEVSAPGGIAVFRGADVELTLKRSNITVPAQPAASNQAPAVVADPAGIGPAGGHGETNGCAGPGIGSGGNGGQRTCLDPSTMLQIQVYGGKGGPGASLPGNPGLGPANVGTGGAGGPPCATGGNASQGAAGMPGLAATGLGTLGPFGFIPSAGTSGLPGFPGAGGGGGGGDVACGGPWGAGGGGGGSGGCGGLVGGLPGSAGRSAIGLVVFGAGALSLVDVAFSVGAGGNGGKGQDGQDGSAGGNGGGAWDAACDGGKGGKGGRAGGGGGGVGGHSMAVLYSGTAPALMGTNSAGVSAPGLGGNGGIGAPAGDPGQACAGAVDFETGSCTLF